MSVTLKERVYWNNKSYNDKYYLRKNFLRSLCIILILITPFTLWLSPFVPKYIKKDMYIGKNIGWRIEKFKIAICRKTV